jgi:hypothetical protein
MTDIPCYDLSAIELSPATRGLLPLRSCNAALEQQRKFGTWWIAPIAQTGAFDLVGFRLLPGTLKIYSPIVLSSGAAAVTIATTSAQLVPIMVIAQIASAPQRWAEAAVLGAREWDELVAAHRVLGGRDDLDALREMVHYEELRAICAQPGALRNAAVAEAFNRIDSAGLGTLRDVFCTAVEGCPWPATHHDYKSHWDAALHAIRFDPKRPLDVSLAAAWGLFQHPAGLDNVWGDPLDPWPAPDAAEAGRRLHRAARWLIAHADAAPADWRSDPLWPAIAALASAPSAVEFHGGPFLEAATALDGVDQAERALHALTAGSFWSCLAGGTESSGALEAAHALARRRHWPHLEANTGALIGGSASQRPVMEVVYHDLADPAWRHAAEVAIARLHKVLLAWESARVVVSPWRSDDGIELPYVLRLDACLAHATWKHSVTAMVRGDEIANGNGQTAASDFLASAGFPDRQISIGHLMDVLYLTEAIESSWLPNAPSLTGTWDRVTEPHRLLGLVPSLEYTEDGAMLRLYRQLGVGGPGHRPAGVPPWILRLWTLPDWMLRKVPAAPSGPPAMPQGGPPGMPHGGPPGMSGGVPMIMPDGLAVIFDRDAGFVTVSMLHEPATKTWRLQR